jgi:hypothetical protein
VGIGKKSKGKEILYRVDYPDELFDKRVTLIISKAKDEEYFINDKGGYTATVFTLFSKALKDYYNNFNA